MSTEEEKEDLRRERFFDEYCCVCKYVERHWTEEPCCECFKKSQVNGPGKPVNWEFREKTK